MSADPAAPTVPSSVTLTAASTAGSTERPSARRRDRARRSGPRHRDADTPASALAAGRASWAERLALGTLAGLRRGHLRLALPDGRVRDFGAGAPHAAPASASATVAAAGDGSPATWPGGIPTTAHVQVRCERFFRRCVLQGDIGFAESYLDGDWDTPDLTAVIAWFVANHEHAPTLSGSRRARTFALGLLRAADRLGHLLRPNSRRTAGRNIREHYDLSNAFFALFLDPSMMYSSARWPAHAPDLPLAAAQLLKNDALCQSLRLQPSDHVLEIGSGWGGWAIHAAQHYGCRVTSLTLSPEQQALATARIAAAGLSDRVAVQLCDYRDVRGTFDKIVSIEMLEAVGHRYLPDYTAALARCLKPQGLLALQFITVPDHRYDALRRGVDFIQKHIFPGSLLLSLNRVNEQLNRAGGFVLHALHDMGPDYARTLRLWRDAFHARLDEVRALGFDERFIRKWRYYLCYCEAAFALRHISVVQTLHTRADNHAL